MNEMAFRPGALVRARHREWVVQPGSRDSMLVLRPLGGSDEDIQIIDSRIELAPIEPAQFDPPDPNQPGSYHSALLLRDALRLKLRAGAGPFRSFGHIAVDPYPFQLVPLMMALKQDVIRLLIADDVGTGKTIEAGLIVREMFDRGEISRFAVLCPPHLVEQWTQELREKFHFDAMPLSAATVARLERETPPNTSIFSYYKALVISLDYIKRETHRDAFLANAPEMILVDEAHTCTMENEGGRQLRYQLVKKLADNHQRHMLLLTATPHSGKETAFHNLLALLKPEFTAFDTMTVDASHPLRQQLAQHFVQRRRKDIEEWKDNSRFPERRVKEETYRLTGEWERFYNRVLDYWTSRAVAQEQQSNEQKKLIIWYATLSILRCASSSPAAAAATLQKSLNEAESLSPEKIEAEMFDNIEREEDESSDDEPASVFETDLQLKSLIDMAKTLRDRKGDPKLEKLIDILEDLLASSCHPVVFCRYIATAEYVAEHLRDRFKDCTIDAVTGQYTPEERKERIEALMKKSRRVLIATDCLSEGINLQHGFNAVVHYDLAWNPTRHEQREGRIDRCGQQSREVRCVMLYGADNPVDGFVLKVILEKARKIRNELGILVPVPEESPATRLAQMKAMLLRKGRTDETGQGHLDFFEDDSQESEWQNYLDRMKTIRTIFAQHRLKPQDVLPEYEKQAKVIGESATVERFVKTALSYLQKNNPLSKIPGFLEFKPSLLDDIYRERFQAIGFDQDTMLSFTLAKEKPEQANIRQENTRYIHRTNPFVTLIADIVLETALDSAGANAPGDSLQANLLRRGTVFETKTVNVLTRIYLIRLRYNIACRQSIEIKHLLAEEALPVAVKGIFNPHIEPSDGIDALLDAVPSGNIDRTVMVEQLSNALQWYMTHEREFEEIAKTRAQILLDDHRRVRQALQARVSYEVNPHLPVDLVGMFVLLPSEL